MKRPQERYAWDSPEEYEANVTDIDPKKEQVILDQYARSKERILSRPTKILIALVVLIAVGVMAVRYWMANKERLKDTGESVVPNEILAAVEGAGTPDPQTAVTPAQPAAPGAPAEPPEAVSGVMEQLVPVGNVLVLVEDLLVKKSPTKKCLVVALLGAIGNAGPVPLTLPKVSVWLLDEAERRYDPVKQENAPIPGPLNPLLRVEHKWAFDIPQGIQLSKAVFRLDAGTAEVNLDERTPDNAAQDKTQFQERLATFLAAVLLEQPAPPKSALETQLAAATAALKVTEDRRAQVQAQYAALAADLDQARPAIAQGEKKAKSAAALLARAQSQLTSANSELNTAQMHLDQLLNAHGRNAPPESQFNHTQQELDRAQHHVEEATKYAAEKQQQLKDAEKQRDAAAKKAEELLHRLEEAGKKLAQERDMTGQAQERVEQLKAQGELAPP
jgi:hypothetical protein